jgi:anti-anti-sigma factor
MTDFLVECVEDGGTFVVTPHGDAGFRQSELLGEALASVAARRPRRVVLNLSRLSFISSVGMGVLISFKHALARDGATLTLAEVPPRIAESLRAARLLDWLSSGHSPAALPRQSLPTLSAR